MLNIPYNYGVLDKMILLWNNNFTVEFHWYEWKVATISSSRFIAQSEHVLLDKNEPET